MGTQIAAQVGGTLAYLVEAVERRIVPVLARTRHDGRFGGALHCDRHPSESRVAVQRAESGERSAGESAFSIVFSRISDLGSNSTTWGTPHLENLEISSSRSIPWNFSSRTSEETMRNSIQKGRATPRRGGFACSRCRGELPAA